MKNYITKQLKERASVKGKQRTWVSECSGEQLYLLFQRLRNGESARSIAGFVQETWKIRSESDVHSLSQGILKFKKRIEDLLELEMGEPASEAVAPTCVTEEDNLDELMGLERLVRLQRERVERMIKEEQEQGLKHPNLSKDLQSLTALSKALTKEKEFTLKHPGGIDHLKKRREQARDRRIDANFKIFLESTPDDDMERLLTAMDKFLELAAQHAVRMAPKKDANGNVRYVTIREEAS